MPDKGTVVPLAPSAARLAAAEKLETPQNFVPATTVQSGQWAAGGPARKMMPVGVVGELGSAYTVEAADGEEGTEDAAAPEATVHGEWKEVYDPAAKSLYYFNGATGETQWERPAEMGPTPHSSGWFGRGAAGSTAAKGYEANNVEYLKRPARKQVDYIASKNSVLEGAYEYNLWWGKYIGEHWDNGKSREPAETRCADLERFASDEMRDVFGRERHKDFRDDMTGVGALMKPCRTLYVGSLLKAEYADPLALEEALWRNFGEWGEVENINLISRLSIAFVRYRHRSGAEFAFQAMSNNHLDHEENLNIRWAHDDPNPVAHDAAARADADALVEMMKARGVEVTDSGTADFETPADYRLPAAKRLKTADGDDAGAYPDTDVQFSAADRAAEASAWTAVPRPEGGTHWWNEATGGTSNDAPAVVADANCDVANAALDAADRPRRRWRAALPAGWQALWT
ncbi:RNA binding-protein [Aureococcus anophagefferens]|nr:RNA binding-protein [Aureococcus anophagefferens]